MVPPLKKAAKSYFDDSSSDDGDNPTPSTVLHDEESDEDELDAFMRTNNNGNDHDPTEPKSPRKEERLDLLAEKEYDDYEDVVRSEMQASSSSSSAASSNDPTSFDDESSQTGKRKHQKPLLLPITDHRNTNYPSFVKNFLTATAKLTIDTDENHVSVKDYLQSQSISVTFDSSPSSLPSIILPITSLTSSSNDDNDDEDDASSIFPPLSSYNHLPPSIHSTLTQMNINNLTPIQSITLPLLLSGLNVLATSPTGSGKTLAFLIPLTTHLLSRPRVKAKEGPIGLILTPTRELAQQIFLVTKRILSSTKIKSIPLFGGVTTHSQHSTYNLTKLLKQGVEVIIATPARLIDFVRSGATNFRNVSFVVLDEGDQLSATQFVGQLDEIVCNLNPDAQRVAFSATFSNSSRDKMKEWLGGSGGSGSGGGGDGVVSVKIGVVGRSSVYVEQEVVICRGERKNEKERTNATNISSTPVPPRSNTLPSKQEWLFEFLPSLCKLGRMIIFVKRRIDCESLVTSIRTNLALKSVTCDCIHGDMAQSSRSKALLLLKRGEVNVLIATDVASRGLDVKDVAVVINFEKGKNLDAHSHRVGRAGRMSSEGGEYGKGKCFTLLEAGDVSDKRFGEILIEQFRREKREVSREFEEYVKGSGKGGGSQKNPYQAQHRQQGEGNGNRNGNSNPYQPQQHHQQHRHQQEPDAKRRRS